MKKYKFLIAVAICFSLSVTNSFAWDSVYINTGEIAISGSAEKNSEIMLQILQNDFLFSEDEWLSGDASGFEYLESSETGIDGTYEFKVGLSKSGAYKATVFSSGKRSVSEILYVNTDEFKNAVTAVNAVKNNASEMAEVLKENRAGLGLWIDLYDSADFQSAAKLLCSLMNGNEFVESDGEKIIKCIERSFVVSALNSGSVKNLDKYEYCLGLDSTIEQFWIKEHADEIAERTSKRAFSTCDEALKAISEAAALVRVKYADGFGDVKTVISKYSDEIGVSNVSDSVARTLANKDYANMGEFKAAVKKAVSDSDSSSGSTGGGKTSVKGSSLGVNTGKNTSGEDKIKNFKRFKDLDGYDWAASEIEELASLGILNGRSFDSFCPGENIKREEFVSLVTKLFSIQVSGNIPEFIDISDTDWFYDSVCHAYNSGIIKGISENAFGTGSFISRQDCAVIVCRALEICNVKIDKAGTPDYSDAATISPYAADAVCALQKSGLMIGNSGKFMPQNNITRAEAAKLIYNLLKYR